MRLYQYAFAFTFLAMSLSCVHKASMPSGCKGLYGNSRIQGTIRDEALRIPLIGVPIELKSTSKGVECKSVTDNNGHYCFSNIPSSEDYRLIINGSGYFPVNRVNFDVPPFSNMQADYDLCYWLDCDMVVLPFPSIQPSEIGGSTVIQSDPRTGVISVHYK